MAKTMKQQSQAGFLMAKIRQVGERIFVRRLKQYGIEINPAQGRIMFALWQKDGVSINELAKKTQLKKSTLTSMLDRLEKLGYIKRLNSKEDRRKILIQRTRKDRALESKYVKLSQEITRLFYNGFSKSQIDRFERDLARILDNLTAFEKEQNGKGTFDKISF
ncbi:MAG: MarR family winged helix-turn-helix transcriptional regulator [Planctomycetota bacterium]|jgi:DNA-binding MarR family transcriptional regulator